MHRNSPGSNSDMPLEDLPPPVPLTRQSASSNLEINVAQAACFPHRFLSERKHPPKQTHSPVPGHGPVPSGAKRL